MPGLSVSFIGYSARKPRRLGAAGSAAPYVELPLRVALPLTLKIDGGGVAAADEHGDALVRGGPVPVGARRVPRGGAPPVPRDAQAVPTGRQWRLKWLAGGPNSRAY